MDILKKMFKLETENAEQEDASTSQKDEFRKPQWFEEAETDDELFDDDRKFAFQMFTSPLEMQKHFESQLQRLLESINDNYENGARFEKNLKEDFLKPGFESNIMKEFEKQKNDMTMDTDLDGEIYADQLHSLIQRLNLGENLEQQQQDGSTILRSNQRGIRKAIAGAKLSDEDIIMGRIHGTISADGELQSAKRSPNVADGGGRPDMMTPMTPMLPRSGMTPFGGAFDGTFQGPRMFSQSVMSKTVRKPDGSYETTQISQDSTGKRTTTVTRMIDGKKETVVTQDNDGHPASVRLPVDKKPAAAAGNRNVFVTKEGYAMPRNLW